MTRWTPRRAYPWSSTTSRPARCTNAPLRTSAPTCCSASRDRADGRELVRRLHRIVNPAGRRRQRRTRPRSRSPSPTTGWRRSGCRRRRWTASRRSSGRGWRPGPRSWGTSARAGPTTGRSPSGTADVHVAIAVLSSDEARLRAVAEKAREAHAELPGVELIWRQDCYQLATGRTSFGFKDGIGQPAVEGSGRPPRIPASGRSRPARSSWAIPTRRASCRPCRPRRCWAATAPTSCSASCTPRWRRTGATCAPGQRRGPRRTSSGRRWSGAGRAARPSRSRPTRDDPELGSDPRRNNDFVFGDDPRGFKCPVGAHARRANPRDALDHEGSVDVRLHRMIRRGTSYGPMLPDGVTEDDGVDRGHHLRLRRRPPQTAVRVRQDPVAQRRHLHRRPARVRPPRRTSPRPEQLHDPATTDPPPAAGPAAVRGHPRRRVLLRPEPERAALARRAGHLTRRHPREEA